MKVKIKDYSDIKVGDVWLGQTVTSTTYCGSGLILSGGGDLSPLAVTAVIAAGLDEVERKPEKVTFSTTISGDGCHCRCATSMSAVLEPSLAPFVGQNVKVTVEAE